MTFLPHFFNLWSMTLKYSHSIPITIKIMRRAFAIFFMIDHQALSQHNSTFYSLNILKYVQMKRDQIQVLSWEFGLAQASDPFRWPSPGPAWEDHLWSWSWWPQSKGPLISGQTRLKASPAFALRPIINSGIAKKAKKNGDRWTCVLIRLNGLSWKLNAESR